MKSRAFAFLFALLLVLGLGVPAWAQLEDPLHENYFSHVIPYYNRAAGHVPLLVVSDTSYVDFPASPASARVQMFFFNQACNFVRDANVDLTENDVAFLNLTSVAFAGIPSEGEIVLTTSFQANSLVPGFVGGSERFNTYVLNIDLNDNTITRLDSIPFSDDNDPTGLALELWLRYDRFNTLAATFGDAGLIRTTVTFFNAVGGGHSAAPVGTSGTCAGGAGPVPCTLGSVDTLREMLIHLGGGAAPYGNTLEGDWVVTGGSDTTSVSAGSIHLFAFDDDENSLGSFIFSLPCFLRGRLTTFAPTMTAAGHAWAFSLDPAAIGGGGWSAFQETNVELGAVDAILSGYWHHRE